MTREAYERYLKLFNDRRYEEFLAYYHDDLSLVFAGYEFNSKAAVKGFYRFFHTYVKEHIELTAFVGDAGMVAIEARVRLEAIKALNKETLSQQGLDNIIALRKGQVIEIPQFIHYHLREGRFHKVLCSVFQPPVS